MTPPWLVVPALKWGALLILVLGLLTWGQTERSGRLEATRKLEAATADLANRSAANEVQREVDRAPDGDAAERLQREWSR